jgi:hypothetical protein
MMRQKMKPILGHVLLAVLGFALADCGSTKKAYVNMGGLGGPAYVVHGTTTISNVATGDLVRCKGGPSANVPTPGGAVAVGRDRLSPTGTPSSTSSRGEIQLTRLRDGSVTVTCTSK